MQIPFIIHFSVVLFRKTRRKQHECVVYPIEINGQEILIVYDDKLVTWFNATDLIVRAGLYWFIEKHSTLYRDSGIDRPVLSKDFIRDRETVRKLFDEWKKKGLIISYEEVKEGRSYVGIEFEVAPKSGEVLEEKTGKSGE